MIGHLDELATQYPLQRVWLARQDFWYLDVIDNLYTQNWTPGLPHTVSILWGIGGVAIVGVVWSAITVVLTGQVAFGCMGTMFIIGPIDSIGVMR